MIASSTMPSPAQAAKWYRPLIEGNEQAVMLLLVGETEGEPDIYAIQAVDAPPRLALEALLAQRKEAGRPAARWVVLNSEIWIREGPRINDEPGTGEDAMMIVGVEPDGPGYALIQRFTRAPGGVVWSDVQSAPLSGRNGISGPMHDILIGFVS